MEQININNDNEDYRLKYIEEKLGGHEDRIKGLEQMSSEFTKISTILEMQAEQNREQNETLKNVNKNLTTLNATTQTLHERVSDLETEVKDVRKRDSISISDTIKKSFWTVCSLTIGAIMAWVFAHFGG